MMGCGIPGIEGAQQTEQGRFKLDFREISFPKGNFHPWESDLKCGSRNTEL